ncbi:MAG: pre-peptidase C-terminal domain-containing protein [Bacteroidia bacterium]|nr:pre-peptidase C-terminal domain-containing protein [Bacteroidia bacterium]
MEKKLLGLLVFLCIGLTHSYSQGNTCATATALTINGACDSGSIGDATENAPFISSCSGSFRDEGWYTFTVTSGPQNIVITANSGNRNLYLQLISSTGLCAGLTQIACANANTSNNSAQTETISTVLGNGTYYVKVVNVATSGGNMNLNSICITAPPVNDNCPGTVLTVNPGLTCVASTNGTTAGATQSVGPIICNGFSGSSDDDVWYQFTATSTNHNVTVTPTTLNDAVVEILSGPCNGTSLACADGTTGLAPETASASGLTLGNTYYVRVYSFGGPGSQGAFNICVTTGALYCQPTTDSPSNVYIDNVSFLGTLQDVSNNGTGFTTGYQDHTGLATKSIQVEGSGLNVYVEGNQSSRIKAWVDWNGDGNYDDATEEVYDTNTIATLSTTFGFIIPMGTAAGDYRIRIRNFKRYSWPPPAYSWGYDFNACENFVNGVYYDYGEAEDYLFTVEPFCDALITGVTGGDTCGVGTADLSVTGSATATGFRWYDSQFAGTMLYDDAAGTGNWTTPSIGSTTSYWVAAYSGSCESLQRVEVVARYNPTANLSISPAAAGRILCGENDSLQLDATGDVDEVVLFYEDFESGMGIFYNHELLNNGPAIDPLTAWQVRSSTFIPSEMVWYPAIASGFTGNQFAMSNSDIGPQVVDNALETTGSYDTTDFDTLTLSFRMYYSHYYPDGTGGVNDYVAVEASTNGGSWFNVAPDIISDVGIGTRFEEVSFDLASYIDEPTLYLRIRFYGAWVDGVAVDDVRLFGNKDITSVEWTVTPPGSLNLYEDAAGAIPYTGGDISTVFAIPDSVQIETGSYTITADTNLANNCGNASENITITNNTRIWNGTTNRWDTGGNWVPNVVPDATSCIIVRDNGSSAPDPLIGIPMPPLPQYGYNLTVKPGGFLEIGTQRWLTLTDWVNVEAGGLLYIRDSGSLIQINDVANTGDIHMERSPKFNGNPVLSQEYVYWSSPVDAYDIAEVSPNAGSYSKWEWIPSVAGNGSGDHGDWNAATGAMTVGKGYIVRGLSGTSSNYPITGFPSVTLPSNTALFSGVANNGNINIPIYHSGWNTGSGSYTGPSGNTATELDDNWNLVGNPYPSSISADDFIFANAANIADDNNAGIIGTVWLWPHTSGNSTSNPNPFYDNFAYNYNDSDYTEYNYMGANPPGFNGYIAAGQSFFVLADDSADTSGLDSVSFTNNMRNDTYSNDNFLGADPTANFVTIEGDNDTVNTNNERHRIWLDLVTPDNVANTILVGYASAATNGIDKLYDAYEYAGSSVSFYSKVEDKEMSIQGRALPFNDEDTVPLGLKVVQNGSYYIGINALDGLFADNEQTVYLEDTYNGYIHDLKISPYTFNSAAGTFDDRFVLRFINGALSIEEFEMNSAIEISQSDDRISISSTNQTIEQVIIHDVLGRLMINANNIKNLTFDVQKREWARTAYLVKVRLSSGHIETRKIINY